ncbi:MAG: GGDEF domain-containing protein [Luteibacter sp.]
MARIHREAPAMNAEQHWRLRYLDAWEAMFEGDYAKSEAQLKDIADHSGDNNLSVRAASLLLSNYGINRRYEEAFALANRLTVRLPEVKDQRARYLLLSNLSQMFTLADQTDLAIKYAVMMEDTLGPGDNLCYPLSLQAAALYNSKRLHSNTPILQQAIDACASAGQPVLVNTVWLTYSSVLIEENQADKAMALLDRIAPSVQSNAYYPHMLSAQAQRAQAYAKLGNDREAVKAALAAVGMSQPEDFSDLVRDAYEVLYKVEKARGNTAAALGYYEHYVAQDKGYLNDITARSLAYEVSQQHVVVQQLETDSLSKENSILRLQQALDTNAVSTSRLYIVMLLVVLASIIFWLYRLKRSQLRFMKLSAMDSLTGILNHQNFMSEADKALHSLERKNAHACLVSIDLDHFKHVNDTHGHAMGDAVLRRTVEICQRQLRSTDLFGRLGGEEFGIVLVDCTAEQGVAIADRIRLAIEASPVTEDGHVITFSASVGLACTFTAGYDLSRLCREADAALYRAKRAGRNRVIAGNDSGDLAEA